MDAHPPDMYITTVHHPRTQRPHCQPYPSLSAVTRVRRPASGGLGLWSSCACGVLSVPLPGTRVSAEQTNACVPRPLPMPCLLPPPCPFQPPRARPTCLTMPCHAPIAAMVAPQRRRPLVPLQRGVPGRLGLCALRLGVGRHGRGHAAGRGRGHGGDHDVREPAGGPGGARHRGRQGEAAAATAAAATALIGPQRRAQLHASTACPCAYVPARACAGVQRSPRSCCFNVQSGA